MYKLDLKVSFELTYKLLLVHYLMLFEDKLALTRGNDPLLRMWQTRVQTSTLSEQKKLIVHFSMGQDWATWSTITYPLSRTWSYSWNLPGNTISKMMDDCFTYRRPILYNQRGNARPGLIYVMENGGIRTGFEPSSFEYSTQSLI